YTTWAFIQAVLARLGADTTPPSFTLAIGTSGTGSGSVSANPAGPNYIAPVAVMLTATASSGSTFTGWSVAACAGTGTCQVDMNANKAVTATFALLPPVTLSLTITGAGSGTVTSSPAGINCSATCSANFANGAAVTLTAAAPAGSAFAGWSGACSGTGTCLVTMTAARTVIATFAPSNQPFAGPFSGSGPVANTFDDCTFDVTLSGSITVTLSQTSGTVQGTAVVTGNWSNTVTGGFCIAGSAPFNYTLPVSGTPSSLTFAGGNFPAINFTGVLSGATIAGTAVLNFTNTTGTISSPVTLTASP
ncbi:MAG: hypothetical protein ABI790_14745, partial [Betaproteobacteria bacterium]